MSLYNALFGENADADKLMAILGTQVESFNVPRYRDCYFDGTYIVVHTRTGGGNREDYETENDAMAAHPWYAHDEDDEFDSTYANFYFKPPAEIGATLNKTDSTPAEHWQKLFAQLAVGEVPENARRVGEEVLPKIGAALDGSGPKIVEV